MQPLAGSSQVKFFLLQKTVIFLSTIHTTDLYTCINNNLWVTRLDIGNSNCLAYPLLEPPQVV